MLKLPRIGREMMSWDWDVEGSVEQKRNVIWRTQIDLTNYHDESEVPVEIGNILPSLMPICGLQTVASKLTLQTI